MRIIIGAPLKRPPKHQIVVDPLMPGFPSLDSDSLNPQNYHIESFGEGDSIHTNGLNDFFICCTSDFIATSKEVYIRTRRVRLVGLEVPNCGLYIDSLSLLYVSMGPGIMFEFHLVVGCWKDFSI